MNRLQSGAAPCSYVQHICVYCCVHGIAIRSHAVMRMAIQFAAVLFLRQFDTTMHIAGPAAQSAAAVLLLLEHSVSAVPFKRADAAAAAAAPAAAVTTVCRV
jgi:hypothetical protein